jgi:hypothetical protein
MATTSIQSESEIAMGQRANSQAFGEGGFAKIDGEVITVHLEDGEARKTKADYLQADTLEQLRDKFRACWVHGSAWRLEVGELLYRIKEKSEHGEWGTFLDEFDLARSTADDYVRRYMEGRDITVPRQFDVPNPERDPDPEADQRKAEIEVEQAKRKGKKATHHATELHVRVKNLEPLQLDTYRDERKENPGRVTDIWLRAFYEIIGIDPPITSPDRPEPPQHERETGTAPVETEGDPCSA